MGKAFSAADIKLNFSVLIQICSYLSAFADRVFLKVVIKGD